MVRTMVQSQGPALTIARLAKAGNVGVETIRYYQRRGLIRIPAKDKGVRHYAGSDVRRLHFIRQAQSAGFTLEEIRELLELDAGRDRARARELANSRIAELDEKIRELEQMRKGLRRLATACGKKSTGPCPILASFDLP